MMWTVIFIPFMTSWKAVDSGIIQKYLSRQVSLQKKRLKTGKVLEQLWIRSMSWVEIHMDMLQDRDPVISLMQFLHLQKRAESFLKEN